MRYKVYKNGIFENLIECQESNIAEMAELNGWTSYEALPYEDPEPPQRKMTIADLWMATQPEVQAQIRELIKLAQEEQENA